MDKADAISLLRKLGLNSYEAEAYYTLLVFGELSASELSSRANIPRPRVYDILARLEKRGFVISKPGRPAKYEAVPPNKAIESLIREEEKLFQQKILEMRRIKNILSSIVPIRRNREEEVLVLKSENLIKGVIEEAISSASSEIIVTADNHIISKFGDVLVPLLKEAAAKGVDVKLVVPEHLDFSLEEVRVIRKRDEFPKFVMIDGAKILLPLERGEKAVVLENSALGSTLRKIIES